MIPLLPPAEVEVDDTRRYVYVNDSACELLGYSREEFLTLHIDDISFPSGAHVYAMFEQFVTKGGMQGVFALRHKSGNVVWIRYTSSTESGRNRAIWTHYEIWDAMEPSVAKAAAEVVPGGHSALGEAGLK